jgi:chitinase
VSQPPPPPGSTLPVAPYIDMGSFPTPVLSTEATNGNLKSFTLAFITASGCKAMWFNAFDPRTAWQLDQINILRQRGGDVKISFGGASGIELSQACGSLSALTAEYQAVVSAYHLNFIDFDIEGSAVAEPASISLRSQAMAALQRANPNLRISLTLPVLPEGLTQDGINVVTAAKNAGVNLDVVNVMAMDYQRGGDYGPLATQAGQSTFNQLRTIFPTRTTAQLWRMVGVTPMLGKNDDGGTYDQNGARSLVGFARTNHLGELSFWELTRDRNACNGALFMCTNITQAPYEFSKIFAGFTG